MRFMFFSFVVGVNDHQDRIDRPAGRSVYWPKPYQANVEKKCRPDEDVVDLGRNETRQM